MTSDDSLLAKAFGMAIVFLLLAFQVPAHAAGPVDYDSLNEKVGLIKSYGSDYDSGKISYAQLLIMSRGLAHEMWDELTAASMKSTEKAGAGEKQEFAQGIPEGVMKELFGESTGTTNWAYVRGEDRTALLGREVSVWEMPLYDSRNLRIHVTILPQVIKKYNLASCPGADRDPKKAVLCKDYSANYLYDFVFNIRPKSVSKPNMVKAEEELNAALRKHIDGAMPEESIVNLVFEKNNEIGWYVEDNSISNDCSVVDSLMDGVTPKQTRQRKIEAPVKEFDRGRIVLGLGWCDAGCDKKDPRLGLTVETHNLYLPGEERMEFKEEDYAQVPDEELKASISEKLGLIKSGDAGDTSFLKRVRREISPEIEAMSRVLGNRMPDADFDAWKNSLVKEFAVDGYYAEVISDRKEYEKEIFKAEDARAIFYADCSVSSDGRGGSSAGIMLQEGKLHPIGQKVREKDEKENTGCQMSLAAERYERKILQDSINEKFLKWFIDDYVQRSPEKWESHVRAIENLYGDVTENIRETVKAMDCLKIEEDLPEEYSGISASYSGDFGKVTFWEEAEEQGVRVFGGSEGAERKVFSPLMKIRVLPPREIMKSKVKESLARMSSERLVSKVALNKDIENAVKNAVASSGKPIRQLVRYKDGDEVFASLMVVLDQDGVSVKAADPQEDADIKINIDIEFLYSAARYQQDLQGLKTYGPPWKPEMKESGSGMKKARLATGMIPTVISAIVSGRISTEPAISLVSVLSNLDSVSKMVSALM